VTPHEYLQRKRTSVAARLLRSSQRHVDEIVKEVGFDSRSTLFRALRRFHGLTPRECRHAAEAPVFMGGIGSANVSGPWLASGQVEEESPRRTALVAH
ncbi:MAG TPA: AraC family transcriptional regulator, partial [Povalibacter sp.]|nr:AraC family transcriptional regulator [Povalibacter sp.]